MSINTKWQTKKLGEVCTTSSGGTPLKSRKEYYENGSIPWLLSGEVSQGEIYEAKHFITEKGLKNSSAKLFPKDTVLIAMYGATVGQVGILKFPSTTNQAVCGVLPNNNLLPKFIFYFFLTIKDKLVKLAVGGAQPNISQQKIKDQQIPIPPIHIQEQIIKILDQATSLRQKRRNAMELLEEYLKSIFLEMFGDPVENTKGWNVKKLKEMSLKIHSGTTPKGGAQVYVKEGVLFLRSQNVWRNRLDLDDVACISEETHNKMRNSSLEHKDLVMTKTGRINTENSSLGRTAIYLGEDNRANINGHVYLIRLKKDSVHEFVLFILTTNEYREYIRRICVGGIDKRQINKDHLEEFSIISPPNELQSKFSEIVHKTELLKQKMLLQSQELNIQFQALMQKSFN